MFISSLSKALSNLLLPEIIKLFFICMLFYVVGWGILSWGITELIALYAGINGAEGFFIHALGAMGGMVIAWFFFPLLYPVLLSFFDDKIASSIEKSDYPYLPVKNPPFWPTITNDILFSLKAIGLNIIFLPLYIVPLVGAAAYYLLNGYLLGTQFFRMVAGRHINIQEADTLQKQASRTIMFVGIAISFSATIPLLNLVAPILGIATMLHLFHKLQGNEKQKILLPN